MTDLERWRYLFQYHDGKVKELEAGINDSRARLSVHYDVRSWARDVLDDLERATPESEGE